MKTEKYLFHNSVLFNYRVKVFVLALMANLLILSFNANAEEDYSDAITVIEDFHNRLLENMKNADSLGYQGRFDALAGKVINNFDTPIIAKVVLGRYWDSIDQQQQTDFIDLFNKLSIATYASRFDGYSGESFKTLQAESMKKGRILVATELDSPDSDPVKFEYLMHKNNEKWQIISVIADGVNDLSLKRAEYANVIKDKGFSGLVSDVEEKIKMYENE